MVAAMAARQKKEVTHPNSFSSKLPAGTKANIPKEPPAEAMPSARLRFSAGTARPTAPRTTAKVVPLSPKPTRRPKLR
jgi:hypothetical protein